MTRESEPPNHSPFKRPLTPLEIPGITDNPDADPEEIEKFNEQLKSLQSAPNKVVRVESRHFDDISNEVEYYSEHKRLFKEFEKYDLKVPNFNAVFGKDGKGENKVFLVVDKIEGRDVDTLMQEGDDADGRLNEFFLANFNYTLDVLKNNDRFFSDLGPYQFHYGHLAGETNSQNQFYLTDVGTGYFTEPEHQLYFFHIEIFLDRMLYLLEKFQTKYPKKVDVSESISKGKEVQEFLYTKKDQFHKK